MRASDHGCASHWGQAVWHKIADCSLQSKYSNDDATCQFCRKLLALPYIPADAINDVFADLESGASSTRLKQLTDYVRATWIESSTWPPAAWSVYGQPIRTNNDVEGWHYRLNREVQRSGLNMYLLFGLLHSDGRDPCEAAERQESLTLTAAWCQAVPDEALRVLAAVADRHTISTSAAECLPSAVRSRSSSRRLWTA